MTWGAVPRCPQDHEDAHDTIIRYGREGRSTLPLSTACSSPATTVGPCLYFTLARILDKRMMLDAIMAVLTTCTAPT